MPTKDTKKTDGLLGQVFNEFEGIGQEINFLQCCLGFLNRRSTFLSKPGVSRQVQQIVNKYIESAKKKEIQRQNEMKKQQKKLKEQQQKLQKQQQQNKKETPTTNNSKNNDNDKKESNKDKKNNENDDIKMSNNNNNDNNNIPLPPKPKDNDNESDDEDKGPKLIGNGGTTDKYVWTQTLKEVEVKIEIEPHLRARNLDIKIKNKSLYVGIKGGGQFGKEILSGELYEGVDDEESTWTLDKEFGKKTKTLIITLFKDKDMNWWSCVLKGDPEIDTKKIEPESSKLQDLDDETRAAVEKMMFDQRQKRMGKPTSKEIQHAAILDKFKQQHPEMDFSNVNWGN